MISEDLAAAILVSSQVLLLVFAWFNRDQPGLWALDLGLALNLLVIVLNGGLMPISPETVARLAPEGQEGIVYGVDASVVSVANAVGPLLGSALAVWVGLRVPFLVAAGLFGLAGGAAARLLPGRSQRLAGEPLPD